MDFFEYASVVDTFAEVFGTTSPLWVSLSVGGLCFLIVYVFQSVGLYTIAKREDLKNKWMAFIPFFSTYYIGVCGQKNKFFNIDTKKIAIATAVVEFLTLGVYVLNFIASIKVVPYLISHSADDNLWPAVVTSLSEEIHSHPELNWAAWCYNYLSYILAPMQIIQILGMVVVLNCFFQTYSARRYFIFTIASIFFPVQGILIFAVRNNKGMRYADYIRAVQERAYRQYRDQQNFYQNPYNQNPYSNNRPPYESGQPQQPPQPNPQQTSQPEDPFSEFGGKSDDPFDEFKN